MKAVRFIFLLIIVAVFAGNFLYSFRSSQPAPKPTVNSAVQIATSSAILGKCHAIQVDTSDPQAFVPDPSCTPGVVDPSVTQDNIFSTICVSGYTKTVRPPVTYTSNIKRQQILEYGYKDTNTKDYEEDHFISLELGGSPTDPKNLWPEPHPSINEKDDVENYLHSQVCSGKITLGEAQAEITKNWYEVYKKISSMR